ncbi:MAG: PspC domain-containing protein [Actinomycetes bacterium]
MSENDTGYAPPPPGYSPPPPGTPAPPRPLLRRTNGDGKVVAGVAGGIARTLGIDPILVRVAFVVLAIFGGSGFLLYIAGWLFIPDEADADSAGERFFRDNNTLVIIAVVVAAVLIVGPLFAWGAWDGGMGFGGTVLLLLVIAGVVALSRRDSGITTVAPSTSSVPTSPVPTSPVPTSSMPTTAIERPTTPIPPVQGPPQPPAPPAIPAMPAQTPPPPPPPSPPKEKSVLGRLTVGVALLVTGSLVALDLADVISVSAVVVLASGLAVVALGLLLGTFVGRSRGLIALGIVLALVLIPLSAVPRGIDWNTGDGTGDRTYRVQTLADLQPEYSLGAGSLTLDLRALDPSTPKDIDVSIGAGEVIVLLPEDVPATVNTDVGIGQIDMPEEPQHGGFDIEQSWVTPGSAPSPASGSFDLTLSAGVGSVTVNRLVQR